jgi:membrane-associated phospholipid phosphatase
MPDKKVRFGILGAGLGIEFLCLAVLANGPTFESIDYTLRRALRIAVGQKYHAVLSPSILVGSAEFTVFVVALAFAYAYIRGRRILAGLLLFLALFVVEFWGKSVVFHPGPAFHSSPTSLAARQNAVLLIPNSTLRGLSVCAVILVTIVLVHFLIQRHHLVMGLLLLFAAMVASVWGMLFLFGHRSVWLFVRQHPAIFPLHWLYAQMEFSFPSGHMARTTFVCLTLLALLTTEKTGRTKGLLGLLLAVLIQVAMAVSLISLGFHWFSDILGGITLGACMASFAVLVDALGERYARKQLEPPRRSETWAGGEPDLL